MSIFNPLEVVGRCNDPQLQVGDKLTKITRTGLTRGRLPYWGRRKRDHYRVNKKATLVWRLLVYSLPQGRVG